MPIQPVLIAGRWREANAAGTFQAENPQLAQPLSEEYPISTWDDCDEAIQAAYEAAKTLRKASTEQIADFLENYATRIEQRKDELVVTANLETGLDAAPRLSDIELPRTTDQLRQVAKAARDGSWAMPTIDSQANIRSYYAPLGPICVFGPNNFPFAFGSVSGGDFAAAIAAGNPVIAKANTSHPATTRLLAEEAAAAAEHCDMPSATVQLLYRIFHEDGDRIVADPRIGATGYTGSRLAGLKLKSKADAVGKPIYLELSSINPVVILPGALSADLSKITQEFTTSSLIGSGQFCTNPGLLILLKGTQTDSFIAAVTERFQDVTPGTLLSKGVARSLQKGVEALVQAGAKALLGNAPGDGEGYSFANTLLSVTGDQFLNAPAVFQTEVFGNASLLVIAKDINQVCQVIDQLEGNLTGCIYSDPEGSDDADYNRIAFRLRPKVGRLINDKMPTGVAVSPAMNHGGPYPATGHPGFTAVGVPASLLRFTALQCFDNVRNHRLPLLLRNENPNNLLRRIDGAWTKSEVTSPKVNRN